MNKKQSEIRRMVEENFTMKEVLRYLVAERKIQKNDIVHSFHEYAILNTLVRHEKSGNISNEQSDTFKDVLAVMAN